MNITVLKKIESIFRPRYILLNIKATTTPSLKYPGLLNESFKSNKLKNKRKQIKNGKQ